ncbi:hypothetical protein NBRC116188_05720 [Oceaniserpentilla sp. 4NH20-0058]|uniref:GNAT family N-acetyltransferase n=1 Tax=Oceaniserpentilla sp. 4NH20-0058 TaxID=3127660 RepID=UPI0031091598
MLNNIEILDIDSADELSKYWPEISELFYLSFDNELDKDLWDWAYLENPLGNPKVSLALKNKKVVGHYAVIPIKLVKSNCNLDGYLSMTTMVAPEFRKFKLFQILAERVYERIERIGSPSVVVGFPNANSSPGFRKRLGWTILEEYSVVRLNDAQILPAKEILLREIEKDSFKLDLSDKSIRQWRMNKPNQSWGINQNLGLKDGQHGCDLMYVEKLEYFESTVKNKNVNLILPKFGNDFEVVFNYQFGFRAFNMENVPSFMVEMAMSDVF